MLNHFRAEMGFEVTADDVAALASRKGYLQKQASTSRTKWQKRYFVLDNGLLSYYGTHEDYANSAPPKGTMNLESCTASAATEMERSFCIKLVTADRIYHLAADNMEEMSGWLQASGGLIPGRGDPGDGAKDGSDECRGGRGGCDDFQVRPLSQQGACRMGEATSKGAAMLHSRIHQR